MRADQALDGGAFSAGVSSAVRSPVEVPTRRYQQLF